METGELFEVTDVQSAHQSKISISLSGVMSIGITRNSTFLDETNSLFHMRPGMSALGVDFEGFYLETEENGGERLVCLLGNGTLPFRKFFDGSPYLMENYIDTAVNVDPLLLQNNQILLVLRYPPIFTVSSREIRGEMTSLSKQDFSKYFDKVLISAQLGSFSKYQFGSKATGSTSWDLIPLRNEMAEDGVIMFNRSEFCRVLKGFQYQVYHIASNLKSGGRYDQSQNKLGPFLLGKEIKGIGSNYKNLWLIMQNVICEEEAAQGKTKNARVSAVLRLSPATMEPYVAAHRTGLSGSTISVEGIRDPSIGQLNMIGCLGSRPGKCHTQISLYFPRLMSTKERNIISGSISILTNKTESYSPILFGSKLSSALISHNSYIRSYLSYNYSNHDQAIAFRERTKPAPLITLVKQSLFTYPSMEESESLLDSLDRLSNDLRIGAFVGLETYVEVEVLSLGPLLGPLDLVFYRDDPSLGTQAEFRKLNVLNISLTLVFIEAPFKVKDKYYNHVSRLHLEGLYDHRIGKMYLIGCRKVLAENIDTERGLDCLIEVEVEVEYPPETTQWLINPTAKITITSQRKDEDPLHFTHISIQTFMLRNKNHKKAVKFRKIFEGVLRVLLLLVQVAVIWSQLCHMKKNPELVQSIPLVLLGSEIIRYSFNLVGEDEILIKSLETRYYRDRAYNLQNYQVVMESLYYTAKLLALAALLLTARMLKLVLKARKDLRALEELESGDVPSEKQTLLRFLVYFITLNLLFFLAYAFFIEPGKDTMLKEFYVLQIVIMAFLLMVQMYVNRSSKNRIYPLRRAYVTGLIMVLFFQLFYDTVRDPIDYPI